MRSFYILAAALASAFMARASVQRPAHPIRPISRSTSLWIFS